MQRNLKVLAVAILVLLAGVSAAVVWLSIEQPSTTRASGTAYCPAGASARGGSAVDGNWTTYHQNGVRAGVQSSGPVTKVLSAWSTPTTVDGQVYAEPLVCGDVVYVATEGDSVYALNATTGSQIWSTNLGTPVPGSSLPCGDINPSGITGTPVIDVATNTLYVVAFFPPATHELDALNLSSGKVVSRVGADPAGATPSVEQQRGALALANGYVYIPYGGLFGDCGPYHGWVVGLPTTGGGAMISYQVPTGREGGIWSPAGITVAPDGDLLVATGNSASTTTFDYGDAVIELSPSLSVVGYFAPTNWAQLNAGDTDIGSEAPTLLSDGYVFQIGKAGVGYLLSATNLGGIGGQVYFANVCGGAYAGTAWSGTSIYVPCNDGLYKVAVGTGSFSVSWHTSSFNAGAPILTGNVVWTVNTSHPDLLGYNVTTGALLFSLPIGSADHFITPAAAPGSLFVAGGSQVYGFTFS